jgi:acyl carrier protein
MDVEYKLRELLLPVLGLSSIDEIQAGHAMVNDLNAESIDFVEILYEIETNFGVKISIQEITMFDYGIENAETEGVLSASMAERLNKDFNTDRFKPGQTVRQIFEQFTVGDLATVIRRKMDKQ